MDNRFLSSSYKQGLNHRITSLSQYNLKVEEYIRKFEQLQMRILLDQEPELRITRFIKGLSPNMANKVDLQACLSFDNVCSLAIKLFRDNLRVKNNSTLLYQKPITYIEIKPILPHIKLLDKGKGITSESPKKLEGKKCFNYHGYKAFSN